jgi:SAM-dependent methyltransferase
MNFLMTNSVPLNGGDEALVSGLFRRWTDCQVTVQGRGTQQKTTARSAPGIGSGVCEQRNAVSIKKREPFYCERLKLGVRQNSFEGEALEFENASFDTVLLTDVLEHIPEPMNLMCEIARILRQAANSFLASPSYTGCMKYRMTIIGIRNLPCGVCVNGGGCVWSSWSHTVVCRNCCST